MRWIALLLAISLPLLGDIPSQIESPATTEITSPSPDFDPFLNPHQEGEDSRFVFEFMKMMANLGVLVAVLLIGTWFVKRIFHKRLLEVNQTSQIKIVEQRSISAKSAVYLIEARGRGFIVAESAAGMIRLGEYSPDGSEPDFDNLLKPRESEIQSGK